MQSTRGAIEVEQNVLSKMCDNSIKGTISSLPISFLIPLYLDAYLLPEVSNAHQPYFCHVQL